MIDSKPEAATRPFEAPPAPKLAVDQVGVGDLPAVIDIDLEITGQPKPEYWYGFYSARQSDSHSPFLVARLDGVVVGYIVGSFRAWEFGSPRCGWVHAIGVRSDGRKLGVATLLFNELARQLKAVGATTIRTMIHIDNQLLMSFFRFQGMAAGPFIELEMSTEDIAPLGREGA